MACNFCATGMMGLTGDLRYAEILEQVIHAERILAKEAVERRVLQQQQSDTENGKGQKSKQYFGKSSTDLDVVRNIVFMGTSLIYLVIVLHEEPGLTLYRFFPCNQFKFFHNSQQAWENHLTTTRMLWQLVVH